MDHSFKGPDIQWVAQASTLHSALNCHCAALSNFHGLRPIISSTSKIDNGGPADFAQYAEHKDTKSHISSQSGGLDVDPFIYAL